MFDSHCHLDFAELASGLEGHLAPARRRGVTGWLVPGCSPAQWPALDGLRAEPDLEVAYGIHPWWAAEAGNLEDALGELRRRLLAGCGVAVGECGLDQLVEARVPRALQLEVFEAQLALARELALPLILHQVRSRSSFLASLGRVGLSSAGAVVHGFSGDAAWAEELLGRGLHLGFGPALLRRGREKLQAALVRVPVERLLLETDAPDQGLGGQRGRPVDLVEVVEFAARCLNLDPGDLGERTAQNARQFLKIAESRAPGGGSL